MKRIDNIHNKTMDIDIENQPYNSKNILLNEDDLYTLLKNNGLSGLKIKNINLYRVAFVHKSYCTMKNTDFKKVMLIVPMIVYHYRICHMKDWSF
jgi:hypothetical protein